MMVLESIWVAIMIGFMTLPGTQIPLEPHEQAMIADAWYSENEGIRLITIQLTEGMLDATDQNCEKAAKLFHKICNYGYTLKVKPYRIGGWVPSAVNPMTIEWTRVLIGKAPDERKKSAKPDKDRKLKRKHGLKPAGRTNRYEVNGKDVYIRKKP